MSSENIDTFSPQKYKGIFFIVYKYNIFTSYSVPCKYTQ